MRVNFSPTRVAFIDFETQSRHDLTKSTAAKYAKDPSTRVLTCVVKVDGVYHRLGPYLKPEDRELLCRIAAERTLVAHNAPFDAAVWEYAEKLPEAEWFDTVPCCRAAGLPGKLDEVGKRLFGKGKDKNGERLIDMLCILKGPVPAIGPAHSLLMEYNHRDVELLEQIYEEVKGYGNPRIMTVDAKINQRGFPADRQFAEQLKDLFDENVRRKTDEFYEQTEIAKPKSSKQMSAWLEKRGFKLPAVNKAVLKQFADDPEGYFVGDGELGEQFEAVQAVLNVRKELTGIGKSKAHAALAMMEDDNRLRDQFVIYKALPGRWAGRGLQPHNLPSILARSYDLRYVDMTYESVQKAALEASVVCERYVPVSDILNCMLRHIVRTPRKLLVADYAQVEARALAWIAGEQSMLKLFAANKSPYTALGESMFKRPIDKKTDFSEYTLCKALILGCGYGMGGAKFESTTRGRGEFLVLKAMEQSGFTPAEAVKFYRSTYPAIVQLWKSFDEAPKLALQGVSSEVGKCKFYMRGTNLHLELPSGRPIVYRNARIEDLVPGYVRLYNMPEVRVPTVVYDKHNGFQGFIYGSKTTENVCQGICADLLGEALCRQEAAGLDPVFHVHDEAGAENDENRFDEFMELMSAPSDWAPDFPLLAEGYMGPIWSKSTDGYVHSESLNGRLLR